MNNIFKLSTLVLILVFIGCRVEEKNVLRNAERVIPGKWDVESIRLPGNGIKYQGNLILKDTILFHVGQFDIEKFSTDSMDLGNFDRSKVQCKFIIESDTIDYVIEKMFTSNLEIFSYFRRELSDGIHPNDTEAKEFASSSNLFSHNYIIQIVNNDKMNLRKANDQDEYVITLSRI